MDKYWELSIPLQNTKNHEVVNEFLLSLKLANRSRGTIELYRSFLGKFFSDKEVIYSTLTSEEIQKWFKKNQGHVNERTLSLRLSILSSFYKFCVQEDYITHSPIKSRWFPRLPQLVPKYLEKSDIAKTRVQTEFTSIRNQTMIELMLTSGCRVAEISGLNIEDLNLENRSARVVGKGRKIREIHYTEKCRILLERYLEAYPESKGALFLNKFGDRISTRSIHSIVNEIGKQAGLVSSLHPHRLRHTFATELLSKGAELSFIADELGHANLNTTQIYARLPKREIIANYRKFMG